MEQESLFKFKNNTNYWLVGSYWQNDKPQERLPEFIEKGIWINGYGEDKYTERVNAVRVGDVLICKSIFRKNGKSVLRIKTVGIVTKKKEYGSVLNVDWKKEFVTKDLDDLGFYRDTIHSVRDEDLEMIIDILNESGEEGITTRILFDDFAERIRDVGKEVSSFIINVIDMEGSIQHVGTDYFYSFEKTKSDLYKIESNPNLEVGEKSNWSGYLLPFFESWLSLLDEKIIEQENTKKPKALNTSVVKHALSTDKSDANLLSKGYKNQGLIGYINSEIDPKSEPLYQTYLKNTDDYIYIFGGYKGGEQKDINTKNTKLVGFIAKVSTPNSLPLKRFFSSDSFNHLYCTMPDTKTIMGLGFEEEQSQGFEKAYLSTTSSFKNLPLYVYSTNPNILLFQPLSKPEELEEEFETKAEILADNIAIKDELGREGLMKILFNRIDRLWNKLRENESYTVLINGEWGSGKSSMLYYLEKVFSKNKWTVVKYNAWENQRFDEPWWILVNKVSIEVPRKAFDPKNSYKSDSHWFWRNKLQYSVVIIVVLVILILAVIGIKFDLIIREDIKYYASIIALIGTVWVIVKGTVHFLFRKKAYSVLQSNTAHDPFESVKKRFSTVLKHKKVAIFIDDLDRCEVDATVKLLEGIQTLFKNSKILYVIAADSAWVSNCFDRKYKDFEGLAKEGQTIGNEFLQKSFQLIVDVPKLSKLQQDMLLKKYLNQKESIEKIEEEKEVEITDKELQDAKTTEEVAKLTAKKGAKSRGKGAERVGEIIEEKKRHYTQKLQDLGLIPLNPRQMKRLINLFTLKIQVLIIAGTLQEIGEENLLRYVLFSSEYPAFDQQLRNNKSIEVLKKEHSEAVKILGTNLTSEKIRELL